MAYSMPTKTKGEDKAGNSDYSQTYHKQTPLGLSIAVCLWDMSACERLKNIKRHIGWGVAVMSSHQCLAKFFLTSQNVICIKTVSKKSGLKVPGSHLVKRLFCCYSYHPFPPPFPRSPFLQAWGLKIKK